MNEIAASKSCQARPQASKGLIFISVEIIYDIDSMSMKHAELVVIYQRKCDVG